MPPKKTDGAAAKAKPAHGTYQDMITDAIVAVRLPFLFSIMGRDSMTRCNSCVGQIDAQSTAR